MSAVSPTSGGLAAQPTPALAPGAAARPSPALTAAPTVRRANAAHEGRRGRRNGPVAAAGDGLAAALLADAEGARPLAEGLRPAALRREIEALQDTLRRLQAETPEDLFELALGALEDELANAERLQGALQAARR